MDFVLDPYVIAVPNADGPEALSDYATSLFQWSDIVRTKRHTFWLSSFVAMALTNNNQYPHFSTLKRYDKNEKVIEAYDLFKTIEKDFMHPDYLDEHLENRSCHYDAENSIVLPKEIENRLHPEVSKALKETLALMAIAENIHDSDLAKRLVFATNPLPAPTSQVEVDLEILQEQKNEIERINSSWRLVSLPSQLDEIEGLISFWEDTQRAIQWAYEQLCSCGTLNRRIQPCPRPIVGHYFNKSIKGNHLDHQPAVLDSIFRNLVLALTETGGFERFQKAEGGNKHHILQDRPNHQAVRTMDGATAWRIHLSNSYRLHYWLIAGGGLELSKVGVHNDMTIL